MEPELNGQPEDPRITKIISSVYGGIFLPRDPKIYSPISSNTSQTEISKKSLPYDDSNIFSNLSLAPMPQFKTTTEATQAIIDKFCEEVLTNTSDSKTHSKTQSKTQSPNQSPNQSQNQFLSQNQNQNQTQSRGEIQEKLNLNLVKMNENESNQQMIFQSESLNLSFKEELKSPYFSDSEGNSEIFSKNFDSSVPSSHYSNASNSSNTSSNMLPLPSSIPQNGPLLPSSASQNSSLNSYINPNTVNTFEKSNFNLGQKNTAPNKKALSNPFFHPFFSNFPNAPSKPASSNSSNVFQDQSKAQIEKKNLPKKKLLESLQFSKEINSETLHPLLSQVFHLNPSIFNEFCGFQVDYLAYVFLLFLSFL